MNILEEAGKIISTDREETYGSPDKNLKLIAAYWSHHLSVVNGKMVVVSINDVCVMMAQLKLARLANSPEHRDSQVDVCGYMALMEKCQSMQPVVGNIKVRPEATFGVFNSNLSTT